MTIQEFSDQFDVLYNNIISNQAPGLNEYEKSLFLTKAEKEIVKNYFTAQSKGNNIGQGFDDSAKRQADFSILMKTGSCVPVSIGEGADTANMFLCIYTVNGVSHKQLRADIVLKDLHGDEPTFDEVSTYSVNADKECTIDGTEYIVSNFPIAAGGQFKVIKVNKEEIETRIDDRSNVYRYPQDVFVVVNESLKTNAGKYLQVIPLKYDEYTRLMSKPFKRPLKNQAWRLMNSGTIGTDGNASKYVEVITNVGDNIATYGIRYVRVPKPIIVGDLDGLTIDGVSTVSTKCEIDPMLHEDILQRAVELAKIAWTQTGQDNTQVVMQAGQRSE